MDRELPSSGRGLSVPKVLMISVAAYAAFGLAAGSVVLVGLRLLPASKETPTREPVAVVPVMDALGRQPASQPVEKEKEKEKTPARQPISREKFQQMTSGKVGRDLIEMVGKPESTKDVPSEARSYWFYRRITFDPVTDKVDERTTVVIFQGAIIDYIY